MWYIITMNILQKFTNSFIKTIISFFHVLGIDIKKHNKNVYKRLKELHIDTVLDIWANAGQSIDFFGSILGNVHIHSFEPLPSAFKQLDKSYGKKTNIELYNTALWSTNGVTTINECEFNPSSSLLKMSKLHKDAFPFTAKSTSVQITIKTLDSYNITGSNMLIKIDTQGFELEVIKWWIKTISNSKIVIIETSFFELYDKQALFNEIYQEMLSLWFLYIGAFEQLANPQDWKFLQQDAIFIKK